VSFLGASDPREHSQLRSRCGKGPVLLAFLLLSLSCASSPLLLLLEEPRSRDGIRSRGSSGGAHARQTIKSCWASCHLVEGWDRRGLLSMGRPPFVGGTEEGSSFARSPRIGATRERSTCFGNATKLRSDRASRSSADASPRA